MFAPWSRLGNCRRLASGTFAGGSGVLCPGGHLVPSGHTLGPQWTRCVSLRSSNVLSPFSVSGSGFWKCQYGGADGSVVWGRWQL
eukprot:1102471-Amphidinium_carterae.3